ncbi:hypothetical protein [Glutamicibacter soli]
MKLDFGDLELAELLLGQRQLDDRPVAAGDPYGRVDAFDVLERALDVLRGLPVGDGQGTRRFRPGGKDAIAGKT